MIQVNLSAKGLDSKIHYNRFEPIVIQPEKKVNFLVETFRKEVELAEGGKQRKKIKKLKKLMKVSLSVLATGLHLSPRAFAQTATTATNIDPITPALVMKFGLTVALVAVSAGVALSMIMLTIAGMYRMFRKRREAEEWSQDIIKGLVQVLISVPTVYLLYFLAQLLFQHLGALKGLF